MPSKQETETTGTLYVVSTPIGNLSDITLRALDVLRSVDCIAAEDTRHTRKLLSRHDIHKPLVSYHEHNARKRGPELIRRLEEGENLALVTDAGTPGVSDPGALLVERAVEAGFPVTVIPGPTALITALVASALPTHPFVFLGFPPNRGSAHRAFFSAHSVLQMTIILYESPRRLKKTLQTMLDAWGNRRIAVARELTKLHEEIFRGTVSEALEYFSDEVKGELTLVVEGAGKISRQDSEGVDWRKELAELLAKDDVSVKDASDTISGKYDLPRRMVYRTALELRKTL